jgi:curved DNA-binding protein CbpA
MTIKKIEEMDCYELLNLERNASQEEIERAYLLGIAAYRPDSLASYGLVPGEDRGLILTKIEEAYQTLRYEDKRKEYNEVLSKEQPAYVPRARFRKSVQRLEIGCAHEKKGLWKRLKKVLFSQKLKEIEGRRKTAEEPPDPDQPTLYRGEYLKGVRENRGLSLEAVAQATRLSIPLLKALEEESYDSLPERTDVLSLINQYARALGLNPREE